MDITKLVALKEGEKIIEEVRKHFLVFFWPIFLAIIFLLLAFFLIFPLFRYGIVGMIIFVVLIMIGSVLLIRALFIWYLNIFVITNQRIIKLERSGFFDKSLKEASFTEINDVSFKQKGMNQTLFGYGSVFLTIKGLAEPFVLRSVSDPSFVYRVIVDQQRFFRKNFADEDKLKINQPESNADDLEQEIQRLERIYGREKMEEAVAEIKKRERERRETINNFLNGRA